MTQTSWKAHHSHSPDYMLAKQGQNRIRLHLPSPPLCKSLWKQNHLLWTRRRQWQFCCTIFLCTNIICPLFLQTQWETIEWLRNNSRVFFINWIQSRLRTLSSPETWKHSKAENESSKENNHNNHHDLPMQGKVPITQDGNPILVLVLVLVGSHGRWHGKQFVNCPCCCWCRFLHHL